MGYYSRQEVEEQDTDLPRKDLAKDFAPLISLLQQVQAASYRSGAEQLAHIERYLTMIEISPDPYKWVMMRDSLGTVSALAGMFEHHPWVSGRSDLEPLFELDSRNF
jgi:hypothetical protein